MKSLSILGCRGIPANHGGFETFAEELSLYLVARGWDVTVYCQQDGRGAVVEDVWRGVRRISIPVAAPGALGTIVFDARSVLHAAAEGRPCLTLGYNTAVFNVLLRLRSVSNLINMDGIEWSREKWGPLAKAWLWLNERLGCLLGNHLVADHPEILAHLATRVEADKITMIPYGANRAEEASPALLQSCGVEPGEYALVVARPEPENSILEIVEAFSERRRGRKLVVLGNYEAASNPFHARVLAAASGEVVFLGAIYDQRLVSALRYHAAFYIHGHKVGGTNPSLVESMAAGRAVLAHDNVFNRWVLGDGGLYFKGRADCGRAIHQLFTDRDQRVSLGRHALERQQSLFTWEGVLQQYETLLLAQRRR